MTHSDVNYFSALMTTFQHSIAFNLPALHKRTNRITIEFLLTRKQTQTAVVQPSSLTDADRSSKFNQRFPRVPV